MTAEWSKKRWAGDLNCLSISFIPVACHNPRCKMSLDLQVNGKDSLARPPRSLASQVCELRSVDSRGQSSSTQVQSEPDFDGTCITGATQKPNSRFEKRPLKKQCILELVRMACQQQISNKVAFLQLLVVSWPFSVQAGDDPRVLHHAWGAGCCVN